MKQYKSLVIIGSSGSGKTTLVNGLRCHAYENRVVIPHRFITRPARLGDDLTENSHIDRATFEAKVAAGTIYPYWHRILDSGRREEYGFEAVDPKDSRLRIYSANNAFLRDVNESVAAILHNSLVVVAMAAQDARTGRLGERSPDMSAAERTMRLGDSGVDVSNTDLNHVIIDTTNLSPDEGQKALQTIVDKVTAV